MAEARSATAGPEDASAMLAASTRAGDTSRIEKLKDLRPSLESPYKDTATWAAPWDAAAETHLHKSVQAFVDGWNYDVVAAACAAAILGKYDSAAELFADICAQTVEGACALEARTHLLAVEVCNRDDTDVARLFVDTLEDYGAVDVLRDTATAARCSRCVALAHRLGAVPTVESLQMWAEALQADTDYSYASSPMYSGTEDTGCDSESDTAGPGGGGARA
jgi:hypothetical protein